MLLQASVHWPAMLAGEERERERETHTESERERER